MKTIVLVGPPFEQQTLYGPFNDHDAAATWSDDQKFDYSYIVTLHDPASVGETYTLPPPVEEVEERKMPFGKYSGKTIEFIMKVNPGYIVWIYDNVANHGGITDDEYRKAGGKFTLPPLSTSPSNRTFGNYHDDFPDDDIPF